MLGDHHHFTALFEITKPLLGTLKQQQVTRLQLFIRHVAHERAVSTHEGEDGEAGALAEMTFTQ